MAAGNIEQFEAWIKQFRNVAIWRHGARSEHAGSHTWQAGGESALAFGSVIVTVSKIELPTRPLALRLESLRPSPGPLRGSGEEGCTSDRTTPSRGSAIGGAASTAVILAADSSDSSRTAKAPQRSYHVTRTGT